MTAPAMEALSDGECLRQYRERGDTAAFEALVQRHQAVLFRHARALLGTGAQCKGAQCEDVVQDAFLRLAQKPPSLPSELGSDPDGERAHLLGWLHTVTRNACMDLLRSETRRRTREEAVASTEATPGGLPDVEAGDTREAVARSLEELPPDQREVLVLRLLGERSYREIAEVTGKKIGTVGWLVSVGLKALSQKLEPLLGMEADAGAAADGRGALRGELS